MGVENQQGTWIQLRLFEAQEESVCHGGCGNGGTEPGAREEGQVTTASTRKRALTDDLMERICERGNLNRAYQRVKDNKGAADIDGMTVDEMYDWIQEHKEELIQSLLDGRYQPQPVRVVEIPKPSGERRQLGIPTVVDRMIQQAFLQVLEGLLDRSFRSQATDFGAGGMRIKRCTVRRNTWRRDERW